MEALFRKIGLLMCRFGIHRYSEVNAQIHTVHRCDRCSDSYFEYWGGSRIPIKHK
jgi:hypothetical protein